MPRRQTTANARALGDRLRDELAVLDRLGGLHERRIDLHSRLVAGAVRTDETEVAAAQVGRFVDAVLAREIVVLRHRRVAPRRLENGGGLLAGLAEDAPQVDALGRVEAGAILLVVTAHVLLGDGGGRGIRGVRTAERGARERACEELRRGELLVETTLLGAAREHEVANEDLVDVGACDGLARAAEGRHLIRRDAGDVILELADGHLARAHREDHASAPCAFGVEVASRRGVGLGVGVTSEGAVHHRAREDERECREKPGFPCCRSARHALSYQKSRPAWRGGRPEGRASRPCSSRGASRRPPGRRPRAGPLRRCRRTGTPRGGSCTRGAAPRPRRRSPPV